jgi:cardiolipin synthase
MAVEFLPGNRLTLLRSGVEYFPALEAAIRGARREIFIETYIYAGDATGERITRALCGAARRGAAVHVLVDGFGSRDMPEALARDLRDAGARLLVFRPEVWRFPFRRDRLRRMHRKIAVADGRIAFVGGINIIDDMDTPRQVPPRYD